MLELPQTYISAPVCSTTTLMELQAAAQHFQIAEGYFSTILAAQTAIFSVIVAALVALYFLFNWKASKAHIKKETEAQFTELREEIEDQFKNLREDIESVFNEKIENLQNIFTSAIEQHDSAIGEMRGQTYRSLAQFWEKEELYTTSFVWWIRAAQAFALVSDGRLTRISLEGARRSIEAIKFGYELDHSEIGEYQKLIVDIDDTYKIEKDLLDAELKSALSRKPAQTQAV